jgi:Dynamin family
MTKQVTEKTSSSLAEIIVAGRPLSQYLGWPANATDAAASRLDAHFASIKALLARLETLVVPEHLAAVGELLQDIEGFRSRVALIGQVKAGKTVLTNAIAGMPGMLPSDVNPWTSVVTSIHMNTPKPRGSTAIFSFYTAEDWIGLTQSGGRLGELARRADFESELAEMRKQITEMQVRTEERLGANFNLLLGSQHRFNGFNTRLLERYICLGEAAADGDFGGRYADVTKSADLYIDAPSVGVPMTISDTPGVNDPFLARERATLDVLSQSDICVVVLSAHQAFSTVDLALMRILLALQTEQIILFVNRIDELENPDEQIREIDTFVRDILRTKGVNGNIPIVYGSAAWGETALTGAVDDLPLSARQKLAELAEARERRAAANQGDGRLWLGQPPYNVDKSHDLSGVNELKALISHKSITTVGAPFAGGLLARATDLANQSMLLIAQVVEGNVPLKADLDVGAMVDRLDNVLRDLDLEFTRISREITDRLFLKMSYTYREFIEDGTRQLRELLEDKGRIADWSPDTEALRRNLNAAFHSFAEEVTADVSALFDRAAQSITAVYADILSDQSQLFAVRPPDVIEPKAPPSLMRTLTIDMKTSWLGNWLVKATGVTPVVRRFSDTVTKEMAEFLDDMRNVHVLGYINQSRRSLHDFLAQHIDTLQNLAVLDNPTRASGARQKLGIEIEATRRLVSLKGLLSEMQAQTDALSADFRLPKK